MDIADILHCRQSTVSAWELGRREMDLDTLLRIADFFGVTTDYLLGRTDDPGPDEKYMPVSPKSPEKLRPIVKAPEMEDQPQAKEEAMLERAPAAPGPAPASTADFIAAINRSRDTTTVSEEDMRIVEEYIRQYSQAQNGKQTKGGVEPDSG